MDSRRFRGIRMRLAAVYRSLRVVVADDHRIVRTALVHLLNDTEGFEVVGEASDGSEAIELAKSLAPDVVVLDYEMPMIDGVEAARSISRECPGVRVVGLSAHDDEWMRGWMYGAGATVCVAKDAPLEELLEALRGSGDLGG